MIPEAAIDAAKRVERIGDATLLLGDSRELTPLVGKVDAVVTDPPYGIDYGRAGGFNATHGWGPWRENVEWDVDRPEREVFDAIRACSREQIIWGGNYFADYLPPSMQWLVWDKGQREFSLADCEFAWSSQQKAARIMMYPRAKARLDGKEHPTQKPVEIMVWCLGFVPNANTILDPFMGVGTTLVACAKSGKHGIGIEIEPKYFDIACKRIERAYAEPDMFIERPAPAVQQPLFAPTKEET
jgi:DNA modification methylase